MLRIFTPKGEIAKWSKITEDLITSGPIGHESLGMLVGGIPFTHTSICGRFGRAHLRPLYGKLNAHPYADKLFNEDVDIQVGGYPRLGLLFPGLLSSRIPILISRPIPTRGESARIPAAVLIDVVYFRASLSGLSVFRKFLRMIGKQFQNRQHTFTD